MNVLSKLSNYIMDKDYRFKVNATRGIYDSMSDEEYLKRMFRAKLGYELNLNNPQTYNEKLQWLKLHDRKPIYTTMVDKYKAKGYVASLIGEEYIVPTIGIWDCFEEIDLDALPNQFVMKCTHDSGGLVVCRDKSKIDFHSMKSKISKCLKKNYYYQYREWPYKDVKPRIIVEQYLEDEFGEELRDYKVLCFDGEPKLIELHQGRYTDYQTQDFYDVNWNRTTISQTGLSVFQVNQDTVDRPQALDEMLRLSAVLAKGIPHLRVDWYQVRGKLFFGEMTFFDGSGLDPFDNIEDDYLLGSWINL